MGSGVSKIDIRMIEAAQSGCPKGLSMVTEQTKGKVFTFLYRMTLDYHLSEDLCQETMLNLIQSIQRLRFDSEEALWAWLFRTAHGKMLHHYRAQTNRGAQPLPLIDGAALSAAEPVAGLFRKETMDTIFHAMDTLRIEYRSILVLRCMNEMSYAQIAAVLGGTQLRNKMLFFHARQALRQELARRGLGRSHFFGALVAFASVTSWRSHEASGASLVHAGLLKASVPGMILSAAGSKAAVIAASLVLTMGLAAGFTTMRSPTIESGPSADLTPLLKDPAFAYPSSVISVHDPDGNGFTVIDVSQTHPRPFPMRCEEVLVGEPGDKEVRLILPEGHWVDVGFDGPILDGPGPDLCYTGWYCPIIRVFLTDGAKRVFELPRPTCNGNCACFHCAV